MFGSGSLWAFLRSFLRWLAVKAVLGAAGSVTWVTEAEHKFSGDPDQDVLFSQVRVLRADPYRDRVFVLDLQDAELSVWTPNGSLSFVLGGSGEGARESSHCRHASSS